FLLRYEVVSDYVERRAEFRKEHLALAHEYADKGQLLLGGALESPIDAAVLIFCAPDSKVVEEFVRRDPYAKAGLVTRWSVRKWTVVVGTACKDPIRL
ncbi:MAG: YciI-like protein, partial [Bdellovibrionota bacterium]